jgi:hypothetical protein
MNLNDKPLITIGAILFGLTALIGGIVFVSLGDITYDDFLKLVAFVGAPFALGSGVARGLQGFGSAANAPPPKDPYE